MRGRGIDIAGEFPKPWTDDIVRAADVVVTMGCGDACPILPGKRYVDWFSMIFRIRKFNDSTAFVWR